MKRHKALSHMNDKTLPAQVTCHLHVSCNVPARLLICLRRLLYRSNPGFARRLYEPPDLAHQRLDRGP